MSEPYWHEAHLRACEAGQDGYIDPHSGLFVMTRLALLKRPCCGNGCRHCPYGLDVDAGTTVTDGSDHLAP